MATRSDRIQLRVSTDSRVLVKVERVGRVSNVIQWDLVSGAILKTRRFTRIRLAISPDCQLAATCRGRTIDIWSLTNGSLVSSFNAPVPVQRAIVRADNQILVTVNSLDVGYAQHELEPAGYYPFVQFWSIDSGDLIDSVHIPMPYLGFVEPFVMADDWQALALGLQYDAPYGWERIRLYAYPLDQEPPLVKWKYNDFIFRYDNFVIWATCFGREGKLLALGVENLFRQGQFGNRGVPGHTIHLWRQTRFFPINPKSILLIPLHLLAGLFLLFIEGLSFLSDLRPFPHERSWAHSLVAFVRSVFVGRPSFGKGRWLKGHTGRINWLQMTPDQLFLLSGSQDQTVRIWQMPKGRHLATLKGFGGSVTHGVLQPGGQLLATGDAAGRIAIWRIPDGELLFEIATEEGRGIEDLIASPDGQFLISSHDGSPIKVWHWSGQEAVQLEDSA